MTTPFDVHTTDTAPESARGLLGAVEQQLGFVPNLMGILAESPAALEAYLTLAKLFESESSSLTAPADQRAHPGASPFLATVNARLSARAYEERMTTRARSCSATTSLRQRSCQQVSSSRVHDIRVAVGRTGSAAPVELLVRLQRLV